MLISPTSLLLHGANDPAKPWKESGIWWNEEWHPNWRNRSSEAELTVAAAEMG